MGERNLFQKYRLCLILSMMAVVLVASALLFWKQEEPPIEEIPESIEVTDVYKVEYQNIEPKKESEEKSDIEPESEVVENPKVTMVTEERVEPEHELMKEPVAVKEQVVSKGSSEEISEQEKEMEPIPEVAVKPEATPESEEAKEQEQLPEIVPEPERIPQEEPEPELPAEEEQEVPSLQEQEKVCAHSWVFESFYQEPTCSNGGLENQVCAHCGETQITGGTPTGKHEFKVETPGDCCSEEVVVCTVCNHREIKEKDQGNHIDVEDGFCYGCGETIK